MISNLPTLLEVVGYGFTAWATGFTLGWTWTVFKQVVERST